MTLKSSLSFASLPLATVDRAAVLDTVATLASHFPVERVVLYGSKARGDDDADSDIDLLILTSRPLAPKEGDRVIDLIQPVQHRHHVIISPLWLSAEEWYHGVYQVLGIRHEIDREGVDVPLPPADEASLMRESATQ